VTKPLQYQTFLRLIGVGLDSDKDRPDLYYLMYEGEKDHPIMDGENVVFFTDPSLAADVAEQYGKGVEVDNLDIDSPFMLCDIADTLHYLTEGGLDTRGIVVNSVNLLLDLVDATAIPSVKHVRPILREIADYCTFSRDASGFLQKQLPYSTGDRINAILLSIGAVAVRSKIIVSPLTPPGQPGNTATLGQ
jgi:hypothetical protein